MYLRCSVAKLSSHKVCFKVPNLIVPRNTAHDNLAHVRIFYFSQQIFHFNTWKRIRYNRFSNLLSRGNCWKRKCHEEACLFLLSMVLLSMFLLWCIFDRYFGALDSSMVEMYRNEENVRVSLREKAVSTLCFPPSFW